jgi:hypothetical protein
MSSDAWGAATLAIGMWVIACRAVFFGHSGPPATGVVWTAASSDKVASHPTLVRRSFPGTPASIRTADLSRFRAQ